MSWQAEPPPFWKWVKNRARSHEDEVPWWAIYHKEPVMVRIFHAGWTEYGVAIDHMAGASRWLARPSDFKLWWHEPILPPTPPPASPLAP